MFCIWTRHRVRIALVACAVHRHHRRRQQRRGHEDDDDDEDDAAKRHTHFARIRHNCTLSAVRKHTRTANTYARAVKLRLRGWRCGMVVAIQIRDRHGQLAFHTTLQVLFALAHRANGSSSRHTITDHHWQPQSSQQQQQPPLTAVVFHVCAQLTRATCQHTDTHSPRMMVPEAS